MKSSLKHDKQCHFKYKKLSLMLALAGSTLGPVGVRAQDSGEPIEEILVTGSFISRPADRPQPVSVLNNADIEAEQRFTLTEVMRNMPQVSSANADSIFLNPTNTINLRGLGSRSTLVLLNGERQTVDASSGSTVDINNLAPTIMIERMELVLDGSSALYGSDAVAGVANFITRNDYEGMELQVSSQIAEAQSSIPESTVSAIFGTQGDDLGLVMALEWQKRSEVLNNQDVETLERLETGLTSAFWSPGTFGEVGGNFYKDPLCNSELIGAEPGNSVSDRAGYTDNGPFCRGLSTMDRSFIPENERLVGMAVATRRFDSDWVDQFRLEMNFARTRYISDYAQGGPLLDLPTVNAVMPASNPGVIDAHQRDPNFPLADFDRIYTRQLSALEGAAQHESGQFTTRVAGVLEGVFPDSSWDWRLSGSYSQNELYTEDIDTITDRYANALQGYGGPNCKWNEVLGVDDDPNNLQPGEGGCQYWNPFASRLLAEPGDPTYNSPELFDWMFHGRKTEGTSKLYTLQGVVTGDLWEMAGGTTAIALGTQYRRQLLSIDVDSVAEDGGFAFDPQVLQDWDAKRETKAVFSELVMYPFESFEMTLAARYEDTEGMSSTEPKLSMLWTPTDNLYVRASAGSSFRTPTENQVQGVGSGAKAFDLLGGEAPLAAGRSIGNPDLEPEESDNWTIGFTWDVTDNFTVEATYWDYEFTNLVTTTDPEDTLREDKRDGRIDNLAAHPLFPGSPTEVCEVTGRWDPDSGAPLPAGCVSGTDIQIFNASYINQDVVKTNGIDFVLDYRTSLFGGDAGVQLNGAYVTEYSGIDLATGELKDVSGTDGAGVAGVGTNPDLRANLVTSYATGNHSARATLRYISGTERTNPSPVPEGYSEASYTSLDLSYTYTFPSSGSSVSLAVINAADRLPPLTTGTLWTISRGIYDGRGRLFRLGFTLGF